MRGVNFGFFTERCRTPSWCRSARFSNWRAARVLKNDNAAYHARNILRVNVGDLKRLGEIVDVVARAGAVIAGSLSIGVSDEASARRHALEAAGKDARSKAEALALSTGKQVDDAVAIAEDIVASNGVYAALRSVVPFAFGAGTPEVAGELEYYARVSASFRLK